MDLEDTGVEIADAGLAWKTLCVQIVKLTETERQFS